MHSVRAGFVNLSRLPYSHLRPRFRDLGARHSTGNVPKNVPDEVPSTRARFVGHGFKTDDRKETVCGSQ